MNIISSLDPSIDWSIYEQEAEESAHVKPATEIMDDMIDKLGKPEAKEPAHLLPWTKTHKIFQLREGECTLWAGVNGHGKSLVTGLISASLISQGAPTCIASFEMKPKKSLHRMVRQFMGLDDTEASPQELALVRDCYEQFRALCTDLLWFYDQQGRVDTQRVIALTRYCFKVGIKHIFIDSLMKCVQDEDDYNGQKRLVDALTALARDYNAHVHLVHHMRKGPSEMEAPDKADVKGSGSITDQVDNVMLVWRNKRKEDDEEKGKLVMPDSPDTVIYCRKQRNGTGWEGPIKLWYDKASMQFTGAPGMFLDMAPWPHQERRR